jgi:rhodanese-related sulfurtransferase
VRPDFDSLTDRQRHDQHGKPVAFLGVRSCHRKDIRAHPTKIADQPRNEDPEMKTIACLAIFACALTVGGTAQAQDVQITTFKRDSVYSLNGQTFTVTRNQNMNATFQGEFARTSRACPLDCIQPMRIADGVSTLGELELLDFLEDRLTGGTGLMLDTRVPAEFATGSIPGGVNVPDATLDSENRFRGDILRALGAVAKVDGSLELTNAMALTLYSGGVWSNDAPNAIGHLMTAGYPANKLFYYRGGMQAWAHVGLTIHQSQNLG